MGHIPAILFLNDAEELELCLEYQTHTFIIDALSTSAATGFYSAPGVQFTSYRRLDKSKHIPLRIVP
jgi:hypothetical protein